jgi:hypothetical protein
MRRINTLAAAIAAVGILAAGCGKSDTNDGPGSKLGVTVAALTAGDVGDACWTISATNGLGVPLWSTPICGADFGNASGGVSYVGVCDAANPVHTVTLVLDELKSQNGVPIPPTEYTNPCTTAGECTRTVNCQENADVLVDFDVVLLLDANFGFVDVTVDLDQVPCSAKLDCVDALLIDPALPNVPAGSARSTTAILAVTCQTQECASMYFDDLRIVCDAGEAVLDASGLGPAGGQLPISQTAPILFAAQAYRLQHAVNGNYLGIAMGLSGATGCHLTFAMATNASGGAFVANTTPVGSVFPYISWDLPLTGLSGELVCAAHPLGSPGVDVVFAGPDANDTKTFDHALAAAGPSCGGTCAGVTCDDGNECTTESCIPGTGCVFTPLPDATICDDGNPGTLSSCQGGQCTATCIDQDGDGFCGGAGDCDDTNAATFPGAPEVCDALDNNCNGIVDDGACIETQCADLLDDDGDGLADCADPDCAGDPACVTLLPNCQGGNSPATWLNDGICDAAFNCITYNFDNAACTGVCPAENTGSDCAGLCSGNTVGDGLCDPNYNCPLFSQDNGDCSQSCAANELENCNGICTAVAQTQFGDGICSPDFACAAYQFDGGDCP